jgi:DNA-binding MarR family transcriptional regulator
VTLQVSVSEEALAEAGYVRRDSMAHDPDPVAYARHLIAVQKQRVALLGGVPVGEPSWDILLDLYVREEDGEAASVSDACVASGVPTTTGLRYLAYLTQQGHVEREPDPEDARRSLVRLTRDMRWRLTALLTQEMEQLAGL